LFDSARIQRQIFAFMPGIFYQPVHRRSFLKTVSATTGALVLTSCQSAPKNTATDPQLHLSLLSDTHVPGDRKNGYRGFNPWENLKQIVPEVAAARPEAVILNGDAARLEGLPADYQEVKSLLEPIASFAPIYIGLGNHDDRAQFEKAFTSPPTLKQSVKDKHVLVVDQQWIRFILLDSLLYTNKTAGLLGKDQRDWLAKYLPEHSNTPTIIFVHHTLGQGDGELLDSDRLFEIVQPHRDVKAIFYGHSHVWSLTERDRLKLINLPAVGYNFTDKEPVGWVDAIFRPTGVDLTLHAFAGNRVDDGKKYVINWS
jgi:Icc protein